MNLFKTLQVEIEGYRQRHLSGFLYLLMIGDLTGESLILKLLRKILQLEAPFSLIEDTEYMNRNWSNQNAQFERLFFSICVI